MSPSQSTNQLRQRGDILLEALIGMLLVSIIGLGLVYTTSRVSLSQKDMNLHNLVTSKLREELQAGNCNSGNYLPIVGAAAFTIEPHPSTLSISIGSSTINQSLCSLSVSDDRLGGTVCVGATSCGS